MEDNGAARTGSIAVAHPRLTAGALLAGIAHFVAAIVLVFVIPSGRALLGPDRGLEETRQWCQLYCGPSEEFTGDAIVFAGVFLLLPGQLILNLTSSLWPALPKGASPLAAVIISSVAFGAYVRLLVVRQRWYAALGIALLYILLALFYAAVILIGMGYACVL